jgi:hypothetical protein
MGAGTPKSSISIGLLIINKQFWGTPIHGNLRIYTGSAASGERMAQEVADLDASWVEHAW